MVPVAFDEANMVLDKPDCMSRDQCEPINVCVGQSGNVNVIISCWKLTKAELDEINRTGRVWLHVLGTQMPPVIVNGIKPEINLVPGNNDGESEGGS